MKKYLVDVSAEATIVSPRYIIKAKTEEEAYEKAVERFQGVIRKIENAKSFSCQPSEINLWTIDEIENDKSK